MAFPNTGILDNFNRANEGPPPSANWTNYISGLKVVSNQLAGNAASTNISYWNQSIGPDLETYITFGTAIASPGIGFYWRCDLAAGNGYFLSITSTQIMVFRKDSGTNTQLGATISQAIGNGDSVGIRMIGSLIEVYYKPSGGSWPVSPIATRTDSTHNTAQPPSINIDGTTNRLDDFGGGTIVSVSVADSGHGSDSVSGISVAFGITDSGHGTDSIPSGTPQVSVPVADSGHGTDSIQAVTVQITLTDTGHGTDTPVINVTVPITDAGTGMDLIDIMRSVLVAVTDSGHGTDFVSSITVQVPVSDTGHGTDIVAAIAAVLSILDLGHGADAVVRFDTAKDYKRVTVTFTGKIPGVTFKAATPGVTFTGRSPGVSFKSSTPGVTFTLKKPGTDFEMN